MNACYKVFSINKHWHARKGVGTSLHLFNLILPLLPTQQLIIISLLPFLFLFFIKIVAALYSVDNWTQTLMVSALVIF